MRRVGFVARFAILLVILGGLVAGAGAAVAIAATASQARQDAVDRAAEVSTTAEALLHAEEASLASFARSAAGALATAGDPQAFAVRLSAATAASDVVVLPAAPPAVARAGGHLDGGDWGWLTEVVGAAPATPDGTRTLLAAAPDGAPWLLGAMAVNAGGPTAITVTARPLTATGLGALAPGSVAATAGLLLVRDGRIALASAPPEDHLDPGMPLPAALASAAATETAASVVALAAGDAAVVSRAVGGGFVLLAAIPVSGGTSVLRSVAGPVLAMALLVLLIALAALFLLVQQGLTWPLRRLDRAVAGLAREDLAVPVPQGGPPELSRLAATFESMRRQLHLLLEAAQARAAIAIDLTAPSAIETSLDAVCSRLATVLQAQATLILLIDESGSPRRVHGTGLAAAVARPQELLRGGGPLAAAVGQNEVGTVFACPLPGTAEWELGVREVIATPLVLGARVAGVVAVGDPAKGARATARELLSVVAEQVALAAERDRVLTAARMQANTDGLTGLYNRRFLTAYLEQQIAVADRTGVSFTILLMDVDHFKQVNDSHGHEVGDTALRSVAEALTGSLRRSDLAARLGGDEFVVYMADTDAEHAVVVAEKLRVAIGRIRLVTPVSRRRLRITASIGVAARPPAGPGVDRLLTLADNALYEAKRLGRDRVSVAAPVAVIPARTRRRPVHRQP